MLMIFQTLADENIMLPVDKTTFKEEKVNGELMVKAYFNNDVFILKTNIQQILYSMGSSKFSPPENKDGFRGFSGV